MTVSGGGRLYIIKSRLIRYIRLCVSVQDYQPISDYHTLYIEHRKSVSKPVTFLYFVREGFNKLSTEN